MEIEKEGRETRLTNKSHHSGCLVARHGPVHVAVPVQLAGKGDRTAGGSQGGDGDSVHLHADVVGREEKS